MMNMMSITGFNGIGLGLFWLHLHWFFGAFAIVGFILLTAWGLKHLNANNLKSVVMGLLTMGIVGSLLTAPLAAPGLQWIRGMWHGEQHEEHEEMQNMMRTMMGQ